MNNINMKAIAMKMIEQGHSNQAIASALNISRAYASMIRTDYNKFAKEKIKSSREFIPTEGSKSRAVYDLIKQGITSTQQIMQMTGFCRQLIRCVKVRHFPHLKTKEIQPVKKSYLRTIELWELRP